MRRKTQTIGVFQYSCSMQSKHKPEITNVSMNTIGDIYFWAILMPTKYLRFALSSVYFTFILKRQNISNRGSGYCNPTSNKFYFDWKIVIGTIYKAWITLSIRNRASYYNGMSLLATFKILASGGFVSGKWFYSLEHSEKSSICFRSAFEWYDGTGAISIACRTHFTSNLTTF